MIGMELAVEGAPVVRACLQRKLLINCTHGTVIRLLPALTLTDQQAHEGCDILADVLKKLGKEGEADAARAELRYTVERTLRDASLVRVTLVTGFQNQIRVQFSAMGHPVVGDRKYHPAEAGERRIDRVALHAAHLEFQHPRTGKTISVDCDMPGDFRSLLKAL